MKTYFVTGATGVVGSSLVPVLLDDPEARLLLLIRARSAPELAARLQRLYEFWSLGEMEADARPRITAIAGDTTLPQLGLDTAVYGSVADHCTHIVHAAGLVRMNLPLEEARRSAVGSANNIVALARKCRALQKVDFVSTVGVGGRLEQAIPERWLTETRTFHNTYEQAKAEAEDYLREQMAHEPLPLTIHRPSMVVGDSRNGRIISFQVFYFLCEFLSGRRTYGLYPSFGDARLDIIGCDIVATAIAAASNDRQTIGRILHLCSGPKDALRIDALKVLARQAFVQHGLTVPRDRVLPRRWFARLALVASKFVPRDTRKALTTLPIYLEYLADSQAFDDSEFRSWLTARGLHRPAPAVYLPTILDFYFAQRYAPSPVRM
jgi:thioester reductase-like protein